MMKKKNVLHIPALVLLALMAAPSGAISQPGNASDYAEQLDSLEHKLVWIEKRFAQEQLSLLLGGRADSVEFFPRLRRRVLSSAFVENSENPDELTPGSIDHRRYLLLQPGCRLAQVDINRTVRSTYDTLQTFFVSDRRASARTRKDSLLAVVNEGNRRSEREAAWRFLAAAPESEAHAMARLFRLRNQVTGKMGYRNYFSLLNQSMIPVGSDYGRRLDEIDSVTARAYSRLINDLKASYQPGSVEIWDLKSSFDNTLSEADGYFPANGQDDLVKATLGALGFDLDNLPIYFHSDSVSLSAGHFETIAVDAPNDVRIVGQPVDGFRSMTALMRAAGIAVYFTKIREGSPTFLHLVDQAWVDAIGDFFESLCYDEEWLTRFAGVPTALTRRLKSTYGSFQLIDTRQDLVMARFEWDIYNSQITDANDRYWEFFSDIMQLPKHDDLSPWASEHRLVDRPLSFYNRLLARSAASQTMGYLKEDYPSLFSSQVGSFLIHNYFRFGNRYDWRELVERATGKPLSVVYLDDM